MPAFSHLFGIKPWEIEFLTYAEIETYQEFIDDYIESAKTKPKPE